MHTTAQGGGTRPAALERIPAEKIITADVRDELRAGREPFQLIMQARSQVPAGGALCVRAIFEPVPLYAVMKRQGFDHWTERRADDDWLVWLYVNDDDSEVVKAEGTTAEDMKAEAEAAGAPASSSDSSSDSSPHPSASSSDSHASDGSVVVLDVRNLEPPEPMVRTLAALEQLPRGGTLVQINARVPQFLLPVLEERGFTYEVRVQEPGLVRLFIRHHTQHSADTEGAQMNSSEQRILDVRVIPPREKHPTIFNTFNALAPGESFVLVNDHDPKPLRYQFEYEHAGQFGWEYLEQGPVVWRVQISRTAA